MSKMMDKFMGVLGYELDDEETITEQHKEEGIEPEEGKRNKKNNLLSLPSQRSVKMALVKPQSYNEVESIAEHIKERRPVIVNLEEVEKEVAQRIVDFLSGCVFSLEGVVQKVSQGIFFFATNNIDVINQIMEEEKEKSFFNWPSRAK